MKTYIDSVKTKRAAYLEQNTAYVKNVMNITINMDSVLPQDTQIDPEEESYSKNEGNKSMNKSKTN